MTKIIDEDEALNLDPFEGDFGDQDDRILSNKIVTVRKARRCNNCGQLVSAGERARSITAVFEAELRSYLMCADCLNYQILLGSDADDDVVDAAEQAFLQRCQQSAKEMA